MINFCDGDSVQARIYRHSDGYPESVLPDLQRFFTAVEEQTDDTRFNDPEYLAAKFVVWATQDYREHVCGFIKGKGKDGPLNFLGYGVAADDHGDIEFIYSVDCSKKDKAGHPKVTHKHV